MDLKIVKAFLSRYPDLEEEKSGLYLFLLDADWREICRIAEDEAEYLVRVDIMGEPRNNPHVWTPEFGRYREDKS